MLASGMRVTAAQGEFVSNYKPATQSGHAGPLCGGIGLLKKPP